MTVLNQYNLVLSNFWQSSSHFEQSVLAVLCSFSIFYLMRFIVLRKFEKLASLTENDLDDRLIHFVKQFLWLGAFIATLIWVLKINNIAVSPILAGAGIFSVAIGFAAKETIADILSGIFLIIDRPIRKGDRIVIDKIGKHWGGWGDVIDIGLRRTQIRNTDGVIVNYPNSLLSSNVIKNFSFDPQPVRARIRFQVDYNADISLVKKITTEAIYKVDGILHDTVTIVIRSIWDDERGHNVSGVLYEARYQLKDVKKRTPIRSEVLEQLIIALQKHNIPMAAQPINIVQHGNN